jgi:hypothetical protein
VTTNAAGRRRGFKSWFVEPYRQVKLGLMVIIINIVFSMLIFGVFGYYLWDIYLSVSQYFALSGEETSQTFVKFGTPAAIGAFIIVVFIITTLMVSVRYTYQIYGPLVSIHRFLDELTEGRIPTPLQLRESDQLKELAEKLNRIAERFNPNRRQAPMIPIFRFIDEILAGKKPEKLVLREQAHLNELVDKLNALAEKVK